MRGKDAWREPIKQAMLERRTALQLALRSNRKPFGQDAGSQVHVADVLDRVSGDVANSLAAGLAKIESGQLTQIEKALRRREDGNHGNCLACGKPIPRARLQMVPFAARCVECQQIHDGRRPFRQ